MRCLELSVEGAEGKKLVNTDILPKEAKGFQISLGGGLS